jgi:hypothetical protein
MMALREFFADGEAAGFGSLPVSRHQTIEKDHGHLEAQQALWITNLSWLDKKLQERWPRVAGIGMIERRRGSQWGRFREARLLHQQQGGDVR